ncbi:LuxR C-terminal-related transcriptional regulator [Streptomyces sp. NBC_00203]
MGGAEAEERELRISQNTVKSHMTDILDKLSVGALGEAADLAHA